LGVSKKKDIFVWTLHKSKWLEFENVIIDLYGIDKLDEEVIRLLYVGFTMAKQGLTIVWEKNNPIIKKLQELWNKTENIEKLTQIKEYETYFWLEDMYLGENKIGFEQNFSKINIWSQYSIIDGTIYYFHKKLQSFSKKWKEKLDKLRNDILSVDIYAKCVYKDAYLVYLPKLVVKI